METNNQEWRIRNKMDYTKLTEKDLRKLKAFRIKKIQDFQVKVDAYGRLISEVNDEQVNRLLPRLRNEESS